MLRMKATVRLPSSGVLVIWRMIQVALVRLTELCYERKAIIPKCMFNKDKVSHGLQGESSPNWKYCRPEGSQDPVTSLRHCLVRCFRSPIIILSSTLSTKKSQFEVWPLSIFSECDGDGVNSSVKYRTCQREKLC